MHLAILKTAARIGISVLAEDQGEMARQLASRNREQRFTGVPLRDTGTSARFIAGAPVWFECTLNGEFPAGDHTVVLLQVQALGADPGLAAAGLSRFLLPAAGAARARPLANLIIDTFVEGTTPMTTKAAADTASASRTTTAGLAVELNGINQIAEDERKGKPRDLFWPWFAANISVLAVSYGSFILGFGLSFWQATLVAVAGVVISNMLCRDHRDRRQTRLRADHDDQPRHLRRPRQQVPVGAVLAADGRLGDHPGGCAVLATATIFERLGWDGGDCRPRSSR